MDNMSKIITNTIGVNHPSATCGSPATNTVGSLANNGSPFTLACCQARTKSIGISSCLSPTRGLSTSSPDIKQATKRTHNALVVFAFTKSLPVGELLYNALSYTMTVSPNASFTKSTHVMAQPR